MLLVGGFSLTMTACGGGTSETSEDTDATMEAPAEEPMMMEEETPDTTTMEEADTTAM